MLSLPSSCGASCVLVYPRSETTPEVWDDTFEERYDLLLSLSLVDTVLGAIAQQELHRHVRLPQDVAVETFFARQFSRGESEVATESLWITGSQRDWEASSSFGPGPSGAGWTAERLQPTIAAYSGLERIVLNPDTYLSLELKVATLAAFQGSSVSGIGARQPSIRLSTSGA